MIQDSIRVNIVEISYVIITDDNNLRFVSVRLVYDYR